MPHGNSCCRAIRHAVLYGSGDDVITFNYVTEAGGRTQRKHRFEGIVPNLERRYRETESPMVREELSKFISNRPARVRRRSA
jgi:excinuclease ABC subunit A